ncbi:hypothetical protein [uncultured Eudoraea sp.]|uniref:hypothetical protein n=1 Tax=uncultured Eudoraea sp. TaxID=1035614 RepID=UPI002602BF86|nr:hypothetical protein [uncultured Eudoraea sp.]
MTKSIPNTDIVYQFYTLSPITADSCNLKIEIFWEIKSLVKKLIIALFAKRVLVKNTRNSLDLLFQLIEERQGIGSS